MKKIAVMLSFPYLVPSALAVLVEHLWSYFTNTATPTSKFFGGEVPDYYIILPFALVIQTFVGVPGSLILNKTSSHQAAVFCVIVLTFLPLLIIRPNGFIELLVIISIFCVGALVSLYCLHYRRIRLAEQAAT